jgi:hypothetical protein
LGAEAPLSRYQTPSIKISNPVYQDIKPRLSRISRYRNFHDEYQNNHKLEPHGAWSLSAVYREAARGAVVRRTIEEPGIPGSNPGAEINN